MCCLAPPRPPSEGVRAEAAGRDHGGEDEQDSIDRHHLWLPPAQVGGNCPEHQQDETHGRKGRQKRGDVQQRRHHEADRGENLEGADPLDLAVAEVLDVRHLCGQREARPRELDAPGGQKRERQKHLDDPKGDVHSNLLCSKDSKLQLQVVTLEALEASTYSDTRSEPAAGSAPPNAAPSGVECLASAYGHLHAAPPAAPLPLPPDPPPPPLPLPHSAA